MGGIGHNGGPAMEPGYGFRKLAWTRARQALLPALPLEVVRVRVARAERLGLPYRTYASIRAASGRDVVAFLFSGNALDLGVGGVDLPRAAAVRLGELRGAADRLAAIYAPARPAAVAEANPGLFEGVSRAPGFTAGWRETRDTLRAAASLRGVPADAVLLVAATGIERGWCEAAGLAGVVSRDVVFAPRG